MSPPRPARSQEDPLQQLPASAACEIVKAARASLKDPARPVTPANGGRHLLQSDSYFNRPQTAGSFLCSRDFLCSNDPAARPRLSSTYAAATEHIPVAPWCLSSDSEIAADIWTADNPPPNTRISGSSRQSSAVLGSLPRLCCSSAADCTNTSPLRLASTLSAAAVATRRSMRVSSSHSGINTTSGLSAASSLIAGQGLTASAVNSDYAVAPSDLPETADPAAEGSFNSINGNSSTGSSRAGSGASSRASSAGTQQMVASSVIHPQAAHDWQQQTLQTVYLVNSLPLNPSATDAAALLHACAGLQTLLDAAEDQSHLQDWLDAPLQDLSAADSAGQAAAALSGGAADTSAAASVPGLPAATLLANGELGSTLRGLVLSCLIRLVDCMKADVLVKVGSMMLRTIPLQDKMMLTAAKMLYKLSKDSGNDARFRQHGVLRPLLSVIAACSKAAWLACVQQANHCSVAQILQAGDRRIHQQQRRHADGTVLLYLAGCLKNVSADAAIQKCLGRLGAVATMAQVLIHHIASYHVSQQQQNQQQQQQQQDHESAAQICVQATAVLRNLAIDQNHMRLFVEQQGVAIASLLSASAVFEHEELLMNVSRCLSKLSLDNQCRDCIMTPCSLSHHIYTSSSSSSTTQATCLSLPAAAAVPQLFGIMLRPQLAANNHWGIVLRLAFALGNLTTHHSEARQQAAAVPEALDAMLQLMLDLLQELQQEQHQQKHSAALPGKALPNSKAIGQSSKASHKPVEDLLVKLLRLLGNIAIDSSAGAQLAAKQAAVDVVVGVLGSCSFDEHEELVLNAAAALSNLAFYSHATNKFKLVAATSLLKMLLPLLTSSNAEAATEASRAISNLARGSAAVVAELLDCQQQPDAWEPEYEELSSSHHDSCGLWSCDGKCQNSSSDRSDCSTANLVAAGTVGPFVLQALVLLLGHSSWEVVCSAAGVLVNLTAAGDRGPPLHKAGVTSELHESLQHCAACIQSACAAADSTNHQQNPVQLPYYILEAAEMLLQCVHNLTASGMVSTAAAAGGEGHWEHCAADDKRQGVPLDSGCCGTGMLSILHLYQQGLSKARSKGVLVPDSLILLINSMHKRLTSDMNSGNGNCCGPATAQTRAV